VTLERRPTMKCVPKRTNPSGTQRPGSAAELNRIVRVESAHRSECSARADVRLPTVRLLDRRPQGVRSTHIVWLRAPRSRCALTCVARACSRSNSAERRVAGAMTTSLIVSAAVRIITSVTGWVGSSGSGSGTAVTGASGRGRTTSVREAASRPPGGAGRVTARVQMASCPGVMWGQMTTYRVNVCGIQCVIVVVFSD